MYLIPESLLRLESQAESVGQMVSKLLGRLVTASTPQEEASSPAAVGIPCRTELSSRIVAVANSLEMLAISLGEGMDRLEL